MTKFEKQKQATINEVKKCHWHVFTVFGSTVAVKFMAYQYLKDHTLSNKGLKYSEWLPLAFRVLNGNFRPTIETVCAWGHYGRPKSSRYLGSFEKILDIPSELFNKPQEQQKQYINNNNYSNFIQF